MKIVKDGFDSFKEVKEEFFFNYINSAIPQELQSIYSEEIMKMRGAFEQGVQMTLRFYNIQKDK